MRRHLIAVSALLLAAAPAAALAQSLDYSPVAEASSADDAAPVEGHDRADRQEGRKLPGSGRGGKRSRLKISPYIEAQQVVSAELSPGHDVVTWTSIAAGVDGRVLGRNTEAAFSLRYERRIGWGKEQSGDVISGLVRGGAAVIPGALAIEAGALATRTSSDGGTGRFNRTNSSRLWSIYAGPTLNTQAGPVALTGAYRVGYTEISDGALVARNGILSDIDVFDHSVVHNAEFRAGVRPGDILPVGLGLGAGYYQEDISNLDQRVKDFHARADATLPLTTDLALLGGVGYEKVQISSRDVLRDSGGAPVLGADGRWATDEASPRRLAYDTSGFIWDAGVTWRPSRRTALEAHIGRRYGSTTIYGSFAWRATRRSSLNISVYDNVAGFGGQMTRALADLPGDFEVLRNPVSGDINGCITSTDRGSCLNSAFGAVRSATFRARGVQASYIMLLGRYNTGVALGYDRRRFIAAPGTILASANGLLDENTWASAWFGGPIDRNSSFNTTLYANWYSTQLAPDSDGRGLGVGASYSRLLADNLTANAAISLEGVQREAMEDLWTASALAGVRYSF